MKKPFRKLFSLIFVLSIIILTACSSSKMPIVYITQVAPEKTSVAFEANIVDMNNIIQGTVGKFILEKADGTTYKEVTFSVSEVKGNPTAKTITGLEENTEYKLKVQVTIDDAYAIISDQTTFTTKTTIIKEVRTAQELLELSNSTFDEVILMNDIDFQNTTVTKQIGTFTKVFNGNNKTIRNIHSSHALFGTIQSGAVIKDLTIENMVIAGAKNEDGSYEPVMQTTGVSSRNFGFLLSNGTTTNSSAKSTTLQNITIKDSQMYVRIQNSSIVESQSIYVGAVAGQFYGNAHQINVINTKLEVESVNATKLYIGGMFGFAGTTSLTTSSPKNHLNIKEVSLDVDLSFKHVDVDNANYQLSTSTTALTREIYIGQIAGAVSVFSGLKPAIEDVFVTGNINAEVGFIIKQNTLQNDQEEPIVKTRTHLVYVGGLIGKNLNTRLRNIYYQGNIDYVRNDTIVKVDQDVSALFQDYNKVNEAHYVSGMIGHNTSGNTHENIILENNVFNVTIGDQEHFGVEKRYQYAIALHNGFGQQNMRFVNQQAVFTFNDALQEVNNDMYQVIVLTDIKSEYIKNKLA